MHSFFLRTKRIGFSLWEASDIQYAKKLWQNPSVCMYIGNHLFSDQEVKERLSLEISNYNNYKISYFPIFSLDDHQFIGCCGLRPLDDGYELGIHLLPNAWGKGFAYEACKAIIQYYQKDQKNFYAGHHPHNIASQKLLNKLGFTYFKDSYYEPTGLYHPSYKLNLDKKDE